MIKSMLSPCPGVGAWRSLVCAGSLPLSDAVGGGSDFPPSSPLVVASSAGGGPACSASCVRRTGFLTPERAMPVLLNPTTSTGIGTNEVRGNASSVRPRWNDPDESDTRGSHEFDLKCLAIGTVYADFFSSWGALTSVTSVDFILYTGSPSSVCSPSIRATVIITGLMRSTVPSASRYSLHTSFDSNTSTSFGACPVSAPSFTYFLTGSRVKDPPARIPGGVCSVDESGALNFRCRSVTRLLTWPGGHAERGASASQIWCLGRLPRRRLLQAGLPASLQLRSESSPRRWSLCSLRKR